MCNQCATGSDTEHSRPANPGGELRAVLFDMDGTLTDSEVLWTLALERVAARYGGELSREARESMVGQDIWASVDILHADLGVSHLPKVTADMLNAETEEVFRAGLPWKPGARELLEAVRAAGFAIALVTATHRSLVEIALETLGRSNFDATVAGDEVLAPKPDPQPYRQAMELLGVSPAQALAVEDSPTGSASALAAGVGVLVVPSEIPVALTPGMVQWTTLVGAQVTDLVDVHRLLLETGRLAPGGGRPGSVLLVD